MNPIIFEILHQHLRLGERCSIFLDYDGTLVPFAPTPSDPTPDPELVTLLERLCSTQSLRPVILSGRPIPSLVSLLPVPGLILAGVYGAEIAIPGNGVTTRVDADRVVHTIAHVASEWAKLIESKKGFVIENKRWAVALHGRLAAPKAAGRVLCKARRIAMDIAAPRQFRLLEGDRYFELAPAIANKGLTVLWMLDRSDFAHAFPIYFGDDVRDEDAFRVITSRGGVSIRVGENERVTFATERLKSPVEVRACLDSFCCAALASETRIVKNHAT